MVVLGRSYIVRYVRNEYYSLDACAHTAVTQYLPTNASLTGFQFIAKYCMHHSVPLV